MQKTFLNRMHQCRLVCVSVFVLLFSCLQGASGEDLLSFLVEQNETSREKIQSCSYTLETQWKPIGDQIYAGTAQVKKEGNSLWLKYERTIQNLSAGKMDKIEIRMVVNDKYAGIWPQVGNPLAYQLDFTSFDTMDSDIKSRITSQRPPEFLEHCFGSPEGTFREAIAIRPEHIKWDAIKTEDSNGKTLYHIRRFKSTQEGNPRMDKMWVVDPEKGFLATETISYRSNGNLWFHRLFQLEQVEEGIWFPVSFNEECYESETPQGESKTISTWHKATFKDVKVNEDFPNEQFEMDALNLKEDKPDIIVLRKELDGSHVPYIYYRGKLFPQELAARVESTTDKELDTALSHEKIEIVPVSSDKVSVEVLPKTPESSEVPNVKSEDENNNRHSAAIGLTIAFVALILITVFVYRLRGQQP